jgi:hypothetical protein
MLVAVLAVAVLAVGTASATVPGIRVAVFNLAGPDGTGTTIGTGIVIQHGNTLAWEVSGTGLTPGLHPQHLHPGACSATVEAPILLALPDLTADANGAFSASGTVRTRSLVISRLGGVHWNIHAPSTPTGPGSALSCGNGIRTR